MTDAAKQILIGLFVTVVGGLILAWYLQQGRFSPATTPASIASAPTSEATEVSVMRLTPTRISETPTPELASPTGIPGPPTETPTTLPPTATGTPTQSPPPTNTPKPTRTPTATPHVLYEADWSEDFNGWVGSPDWKTVSGMLVNDGTGEFPSSGLIMPPYQPGDISDYAIEAEIQFFRPPGGCIVHFGIIVRGQDQISGYSIGQINTFCSAPPGYLAIGRIEGPIEPWNIPVLQSRDPVKDSEWHTYRVEAQGNIIRVLLDGLPVLETVDNRFLEGGWVALWSSYSVLNVRSFRVIAL